MNVLVVEPGIVPYEKEINGHEEMKAVVGGLICARYLFEDGTVIIANDDMEFTKEHFNRRLGTGSDGVFGTFFICGEGEKDFCSLTPEQMETYKRRFYYAEILMGAMQGEWVVVKVEPRRKPRPRKNRRPPKPPRR